MLKASIAAALIVATLVGCHDTNGPESESQLSLIAPAGGSVNIDVGTMITMEFTHALMSGMERYVALHEGDVTAPVVAGIWTWSQDRKALGFRPDAPLKATTRYTIHIGGGLRDQQSHMVGFTHNGPRMGGQWVTGPMMTGTGMMGTGWLHRNGTYGMLFTFTTR